MKTSARWLLLLSVSLAPALVLPACGESKPVGLSDAASSGDAPKETGGETSTADASSDAPKEAGSETSAADATGEAKADASTADAGSADTGG